ncbi:chromogranin-A isoform X2 [Tachysurus fulvidraco]|uniref:chromogranin-A isoform X2 n=1 Tax=Tachysurus fulvidraco TaxID=1234273 RepID=UPI001FEDFF1E|nr:chromogranin-A isoform X2 [Tachysurus fulvidraco]
MTAARCALLLLLLLQCVSSLPVTRPHLEHKDVKVIKCIVEVLADVLTKPHSLPVSQPCLETLRTDERLVTVLRHRNFLQELQDIAGEGANEMPEKGLEAGPDHTPDLQEPADQSMLMVLTPGNSLEERGAEEEKEHKSQENDDITSHEEDEKKERAVMKKTDDSDEEEEDEAGAAGAPDHSHMEEEEEEEEEAERQQRDWSRSREPVQRRAYGQQEAPHHSKEAWKSPEEEELKMMAGREPEEHRDMEEGSASKKTEDAEMESLAVMENELENMAQKLHKLRHG